MCSDTAYLFNYEVHMPDGAHAVETAVDSPLNALHSILKQISSVPARGKLTSQAELGAHAGVGHKVASNGVTLEVHLQYDSQSSVVYCTVVLCCVG